MAKYISIILGAYFEKFIADQIKSGIFESSNDVLIAALKLLELREIKKLKLVNELEKGEISGFEIEFNHESFLNELHHKYSDQN